MSVYINDADEDLKKMKSDLASANNQLDAAIEDLISPTIDPKKDANASSLEKLAALNRDKISNLKEKIEVFGKQKSILLQSVEGAETDLALAIEHESMLTLTLLIL